MSDARNSSGNVRGGGAKQTGGAGRTNKAVSGKGGSRSGILSDMEMKNDRSEAKRNLQLQMMSKQLALSVRAACLTYHTEEEFEEFNIPIPDPASAMRKLKAMREFTQNWYDKEFRDEWLDRVTKVWEEELMAEYKAAFDAEIAARAAAHAQAAGTENEAMTIEELEAKVQSLEVGSEERNRLKKKLKKRKQKKAKNSNNQNDDEDKNGSAK